MADPETDLPETSATGSLDFAVLEPPSAPTFLIDRAVSISPRITGVSYTATETLRGYGELPAGDVHRSSLGLVATYRGEAIVGPNGAMLLFGSQWPGSMTRDAVESEIRRAEHRRRKELATSVAGVPLRSERGEG